MSNIIFTGIFFDFTEEERESLLEQVRAGDMPNVFLHHITLVFRPGKDGEHLRNLLAHEGQEVSVKVVGKTKANSRVAAFEVELDLEEFGVGSNNKTPHLTVATDFGVKPFAANKAEFEPLVRPFTLTGRLGAFRGGTPSNLP
jgi:hypothetical protein